MIEVGHHAIGQSELIRREDKLIGPSVKLLHHSICTHRSLCSLDHTCTDGTNMMTGTLGVVDQFASLLADMHLLGVHLVLGKVFHLDFMEVAQSTMQGNKCRVDASDLHTFHELAREMKPCGWRCYGTFLLSKHALEVFHIFLCGMVYLAIVDNITWQWSLAQSKERAFEDIVLTVLVIEEAKSTSTAGSIVDYLSHHLVDIIKEEFVSYTNLTGWFYEHIPESHLLIQLSEQEHLNLGIGLLLGTIESCREHLGVVEYKRISLIEIVDDVLELNKLAFDRISVSILAVHIYGFRLFV